MNWLSDVILVAVASGAAVDCIHRGSLFADRRAAAEDILADSEGTETRWAKFWAQLLLCGYCQSHHFPWVFLVLWRLSLIAADPWMELAKIPVLSFAATRVVWVINAAVPWELYYPIPQPKS